MLQVNQGVAVSPRNLGAARNLQLAFESQFAYALFWPPRVHWKLESFALAVLTQGEIEAFAEQLAGIDLVGLQYIRPGPSVIVASDHMT